MNENLKPCPFCGMEPMLKMTTLLNTLRSPYFDVECSHCPGVSTEEGFNSIATAIEWWNSRSEFIEVKNASDI